MWVNLSHHTRDSYIFPLVDVKVGNEIMQGSEKFKEAFVDSGTTFSYIPFAMWDGLMTYIDKWCEAGKKAANTAEDKAKYCPGVRYLADNKGTKVMCFRYNDLKYPDKKEFLLGYPIITFEAVGSDGETIHQIKWFPSEYLYLETDGLKYCLTADREGESRITFGSTLMRQNAYIFDVEKRKIGIARSRCNDDPDMILTEQDYIDYGTD